MFADSSLPANQPIIRKATKRRTIALKGSRHPEFRFLRSRLSRHCLPHTPALEYSQIHTAANLSVSGSTTLR
jgi:hypothetical protein